MVTHEIGAPACSPRPACEACSSEPSQGSIGLPIEYSSDLDPAMQNATPVSPFRMNTYESVSKQRTLTTLRINTYVKGGERQIPFPCYRPPTSLPPSTRRIPTP